MTTKYVSSALLEAHSGGRVFFAVCFWIWGVLGLIGNTFNFLGATGPVTVGTSAYIIMGVLYWMGGMLLFGLGGLLIAASYDFKRPEIGQG
jgi:hypothetical protein